MIKLFIACVAGVFGYGITLAAPPDSLISVTSFKESYQFSYNLKESRVEVKQASTKNYLSNSYQVTIPVAEVYNNYMHIDDITCKVDNRSVKDFKPMDSYYSVDDVFFSDERIAYFPVTFPKKGSTAEVTFLETITDPRYLTSVYFTNQYATATAEISFKIPRWMKIELKEFNFEGFTIKKTTVYDASADADIITYTGQKLPAMAKENNSPGPSYIYPHVLVMSKSAMISGKNFTYVGSLTDQYAWYSELIKNTPEDKAVISAKAKELTAGLTSDMDKIKAIFYYVQNNIRYIAFEDGIAGFKPEKADEVLRKKYGDCKGMANLTKALLTSLGYDARLCWLGTNHIAYDYKTPSVAVDNHMICGLTLKGKTMFLDATETYLGLGEYAERIQGRETLMEDGGKYILSRIPLAVPTQNSDNENAKLAINGAQLSGTISRLWKGEDKEIVLSGLNRTKKDKTSEAMTKFLSNGDNNYSINDLVLSNADNADKDLIATYKVDNKAALSTFGKTYYIDIDQRKELLNSSVTIAERKTDFWFSHKTNINNTIELTVPQGYKITSLPANLDVVNTDYEFHIAYASAADKLTYTKKLMIKNPRLTKAKFEQWNKDIEQLGKTYTESVILKPISE